MKKIPYGIINFKKLITEGYEYIDKTMYLSKLEDIGQTLIYLRPGRFGKSLFTSMLFYYYDVNSKNDFDTLFKDTYVYKNPTPKKNDYYILKFDFSGIVTADRDNEDLTKGFLKKVLDGIKEFNSYYGYNFEVSSVDDAANEILLDFLAYYRSLNLDKKLYIIIDEYDNFTNAILEGDANEFLNIVGNTGVVKGFYAIIKDYIARGIVDRVFITGICPITLDSMTTGFNIATNISADVEFNSMIGFTHDEIKRVLADMGYQNSNLLYDMMVENYDGYLFSKRSKERVFNATLVMYFLKSLERFDSPPENLVDSNIVTNYGKIDNILKLQNNDYYKEIIEETLKTKEITGTLKVQFNLLEDFSKDDIISLLYYFGYLTIKNEAYGSGVNFRVPNRVMELTYGNYFLKMLRDIDINIDNTKLEEPIKELVLTGKITYITEYVSEILNKASNRTFIKFDEKYIQLVYFVLLSSIKEFVVKTEYECPNGYIDLFLEGNREYTEYNIMIELKYIKKGEKDMKKVLEKCRREGIEQLGNYQVEKDNLRKYLVIFIGDKVEEITEI